MTLTDRTRRVFGVAAAAATAGAPSRKRTTTDSRATRRDRLIEELRSKRTRSRHEDPISEFGQ
jgi:hypothetical protein